MAGENSRGTGRESIRGSGGRSGFLFAGGDKEMVRAGVDKLCRKKLHQRMVRAG